MIFLIDFDGTCVPYLPENGFSEIDTGAEKVLKRIIKSGHKIVLWTVRNNSRNNPFNYISGKYRQETSLEEAERWFKERNIPLYGVNDVPGEEDIVGYSRKALGDILIDDVSIGIPLVWGDVTYYSFAAEEMRTVNTYCVNWGEIEKLLINQKLLK